MPPSPPSDDSSACVAGLLRRVSGRWASRSSSRLRSTTCQQVQRPQSRSSPRRTRAGRYYYRKGPFLTWVWQPVSVFALFWFILFCFARRSVTVDQLCATSCALLVVRLAAMLIGPSIRDLTAPWFTSRRSCGARSPGSCSPWRPWCTATSTSFGTKFRHFSAPRHLCTMLYTLWVLIGAWNPMVWPIWGFRAYAAIESRLSPMFFGVTMGATAGILAVVSLGGLFPLALKLAPSQNWAVAPFFAGYGPPFLGLVRPSLVSLLYLPGPCCLPRLMGGGPPCIMRPYVRPLLCAPIACRLIVLGRFGV